MAADTTPEPAAGPSNPPGPKPVVVEVTHLDVCQFVPGGFKRVAMVGLCVTDDKRLVDGETVDCCLVELDQRGLALAIASVLQSTSQWARAAEIEIGRNPQLTDYLREARDLLVVLNSERRTRGGEGSAVEQKASFAKINHPKLAIAPIVACTIIIVGSSEEEASLLISRMTSLVSGTTILPADCSLSIGNIAFSLGVMSARMLSLDLYSVILNSCESCLHPMTLAEFDNAINLPPGQVPTPVADIQVFYNTFVFLAMIGKNPGLGTDNALATWGLKRFTSLLVSAGTSGALASGLNLLGLHMHTLSPIYSLYPGLVLGIVVLMREWLTVDAIYLSALANQVDMILQWSGLTTFKQVVEFLQTNRSCVFGLRLVQMETINVLTSFEDLATAHGKLLPYARVLSLTGVEKANKSNYPNLAMINNVYRRSKDQTMRNFRTNSRNCSYTEREVTALLKKQMVSTAASAERAAFYKEHLGLDLYATQKQSRRRRRDTDSDSE